MILFYSVPAKTLGKSFIFSKVLFSRIKLRSFVLWCGNILAIYDTIQTRWAIYTHSLHKQGDGPSIYITLHSVKHSVKLWKDKNGMKNDARNESNIKRHSIQRQNETCLSSTKSCTRPPSQVSSGSQSQVRAAGSPRPATQPHPIPQILRPGQPRFSCHARRQDWSEASQSRVRELGAGSTSSPFLFTVLFKTLPHFAPKRWLIWALQGELAISVLLPHKLCWLRKENV